MYKSILVPLDGSKDSALAVKHAAELASILGSEIILFHVIPSLPPYLDAAPEKLSSIQQSIMDEYMKQGKTILNKAKDSLAAYGLNIQTIIAIGSPSDEIIKRAKKQNYDLVVMGSRGLGGIKGVLMGSVSGRVARYANRPVLIVR